MRAAHATGAVVAGLHRRALAERLPHQRAQRAGVEQRDDEQEELAGACPDQFLVHEVERQLALDAWPSVPQLGADDPIRHRPVDASVQERDAVDDDGDPQENVDAVGDACRCMMLRSGEDPGEDDRQQAVTDPGGSRHGRVFQVLQLVPRRRDTRADREREHNPANDRIDLGREPLDDRRGNRRQGRRQLPVDIPIEFGVQLDGIDLVDPVHDRCRAALRPGVISPCLEP